MSILWRMGMAVDAVQFNPFLKKLTLGFKSPVQQVSEVYT